MKIPQKEDENRSRNKCKLKATEGEKVIQDKLKEIQKRKICKRKIYREILEVIVVSLVFTYVFVTMLVVVEGNSMRPTFLPGDKVIVLKTLKDYERNEVVLVRKNGMKQTYIKRIIGIPGDEIMITENGSVSCNGNIEEDSSYGYTDPGNLLEYPVKLGKQEYFVLGDNREKSADSRAFGIVKRDELKGKVLFLFWRKI